MHESSHGAREPQCAEGTRQGSGVKLQCAEGARRERQGAPKAPAGSALVWRLESAEGARHAGVNVRAEGAPHVLNSFLGKCVYGMRKGHFFLRGRLRRRPSATISPH